MVPHAEIFFMKKAISTESTQANIAKVIDLLSATPGQLDRLRARVTVEQLRQPLKPGERSLIGALAHLIHCEARSSEAIYLALLAREPVIPAIHPERQWGKLLRYDLLDASELLSYFRLRRAVLMRVLTSLTDTQWQRVVYEPGKKRRESVYWQARSMALHELGHITDVESKLSGYHKAASSVPVIMRPGED
jgi:hypothetical protein